jgi:hypothetical protein
MVPGAFHRYPNRSQSIYALGDAVVAIYFKCLDQRAVDRNNLRGDCVLISLLHFAQLKPLVVVAFEMVAKKMPDIING